MESFFIILNSLPPNIDFYNAIDIAGASQFNSTITVGVDNIAPVISISGDTFLTIEKGDPYTDAGANSNGVEEVITTNSVNPNAVGVYTVIYTAIDIAGNIGTDTRYVTVNDNTPPVITITGLSGLIIERYSTYNDPGANSNGGEEVTTINSVNPNAVGIYNVIYMATDAAGNTGTATRTVTVQRYYRTCHYS